VLGLIVVLLGLAIAPATGAGADNLQVATHEAHATPARRADHLPASTAHGAAGACSITARRAHLGQVPLVADLASRSSVPGDDPCGRIAADPGAVLHESSALTRCGRSPPAA
jgi:hypothetical protein